MYYLQLDIVLLNSIKLDQIMVVHVQYMINDIEILDSISFITFNK